MSSRKKNMGFLKIFIGILFFLNPLVSFVDILPDFLGCLFLFSGLSGILFLDSRAQDVRRTTKLIFLLSIVRLLCTPIFFWSASALSRDGGNTNLLLSFSFCVLSILLELSLFRTLFEMYNYFAVRHNSEVAIKYLDAAQSILCIFCVAKNVASTAPDFLTLFSPESTGNLGTHYFQQLAAYDFLRLVAYAGGWLLVLGFSIVVFIRIRRFFLCANLEEEFLSRLRLAQSGEEGANRGLRIRFMLTGGMNLLLIMSLFSFDYYVDYFSVLPSFVACLVAVFLLLRLRSARGIKPLELGVVAVSMVVCTTAYVYRAVHCNDVFGSRTFYTEEFTIALGVAQSVCLLAVFYICATAICKAAKSLAEIDLSSHRNGLMVFGLVNAAMNAYNYILPKGELVTFNNEAIVFFAILAGIVFFAFTWRMEIAFQREIEWKSF